MVQMGAHGPAGTQSCHVACNHSLKVLWLCLPAVFAGGPHPQLHAHTAHVPPSAAPQATQQGNGQPQPSPAMHHGTSEPQPTSTTQPADIAPASENTTSDEQERAAKRKRANTGGPAGQTSAGGGVAAPHAATGVYTTQC